LQLKNEKQLRSLVDFNTGVALGILLPFTPLKSLYEGEDPQKIIAQSISSGLVTWLTIQALGGAEFGAVQVARSTVTRAVVSSVVPIVPIVAAAVVTDKYIGLLEKYEPKEPTHRPSFWNSVAAGLSGTLGGITYD